MDQPRVYIKAAKCQDIRKQTSIFLDGWFRVNWEPWQAGHFTIDKLKKVVTISHGGIQSTISMFSLRPLRSRSFTATDCSLCLNVPCFDCESRHKRCILRVSVLARRQAEPRLRVLPRVLRY